jgi:poly[ADP-ribose] polymerase 16
VFLLIYLLGGSTSAENDETRNRSRASESQAGDVPERYYVVENNEMVRVKYLLVYSQTNNERRTQ